MAALGSTVAIFMGAEADSAMSFVYALGFTTIGAAMFAATRSSTATGTEAGSVGVWGDWLLMGGGA